MPRDSVASDMEYREDSADATASLHPTHTLEATIIMNKPALSHSVISKLLTEVCVAAREVGEKCQIIQKVDDDGCVDGMVKATDKNEKVIAALESGESRVAAGTVWLWSSDGVGESIDVLFVVC